MDKTIPGKIEVSTPRKRRKVVFTNPTEETPMFYVNNTNIGVTNWDVRMDFGLIQDTQGDELLVKKTVRLMLSPQHAKAVLQLLTASLAQYEKHIGAINDGGG